MKTILNAITMIVNMVVLSLLSLVSTNLILKNYGSDFNGVVATANQIVNLLLIVEGGFTTAINVALYKPFCENDSKKINQIMSASKKTFSKIGKLFLAIGIIVSLFYPTIIKSDLPYFTIFLIFSMVIIGTAYNLIFVYCNQIMFQVSQKEYLYSSFTIIVNLLSSVTTILLAYYKVDMLLIRFFILFYIIINGIVIKILFKRVFPDIDVKEEPDYKSIKGTGDIMVQKLTSVIYLSAPLMFISTYISTKMASVYAVYSSIYNIIKGFLTAMIAAPVNGFGQLMSVGKKEEVYPKFQLYEYIVVLVSSILLSSVLVMIIPFISLYTISVNDINYEDIYIAILLATIVFLEVIHIPSGNIINVTGRFKIAKNIQFVASFILVVSLVIGGFSFGIYGVLIATAFTNLILASIEIYYTHTIIFEKNIFALLKKIFINIVLIVFMVNIFEMFNISVTNYFEFFFAGVIVFAIDFIVIMGINYAMFRNDVNMIIGIVKSVLKKK